MAASFIQSIATGEHSHCPIGPSEPKSKVFNYERHFSSARLGQIVNIVDESPEKEKVDDETKRFQDDSSVQVRLV